MAEDSFASAVAVLTVARWIDVPTTEFLSLFAALLQSILELPRDSISATGRNSLLLSLALDCYVDRCLKARSISKLTTILPVVLTGLQSFLKNSLFGLMAISRFFEVYSALRYLFMELFSCVCNLLSYSFHKHTAKRLNCHKKTFRQYTTQSHPICPC
ncbi:hypothetical protein DFJ73DRAFT_163532 [Zopfochytrium polystomum]|nr:hypothetical protein DFJ73DRAFT_163532 [Zopfochytrium polystomum]